MTAVNSKGITSSRWFTWGRGHVGVMETWLPGEWGELGNISPVYDRHRRAVFQLLAFQWEKNPESQSGLKTHFSSE